MTEEKDILMDSEDDLIFKDGDFAIGKSLTQEVGIILRLNQGDLKSDPLLGPNLIQLEKGVEDANEFKERVKIHMGRDGKNYNELKNCVNMNFKIQ